MSRRVGGSGLVEHFLEEAISAGLAVDRAAAEAQLRRGGNQVEKCSKVKYDPPVSDFKALQLRMYAGLPRPRPWC